MTLQLPLLPRPVQPRDSKARTAAGLCVIVDCELEPTMKRGPYLLCKEHVKSWDKQG